MPYYILRAIKNRFGSTNEIGVFEMTDAGLAEVTNPSETMLQDRPKNVSGNCAVCVMEGTRPIIAEVQALVTQTPFSAPRRTANGIDYNRMCLIIAVLEKRLGLKFYQNDVYLNVTGGLRLDEPSADLAIALALISGITDRVLPDDLIAFGEIGLSGECRAVSHFDYRVKEASRLGFNTIVFPRKNSKKLPKDTASKMFDVFEKPRCVKMLKDDIRNVSIIIPSLNPDEKLCKTINSLLAVGFTDIICVNDGSRDDCLEYFPNESENITILTHDVNRGKGVALKLLLHIFKNTDLSQRVLSPLTEMGNTRQKMF